MLQILNTIHCEVSCRSGPSLSSQDEKRNGSNFQHQRLRHWGNRVYFICLTLSSPPLCSKWHAFLSVAGSRMFSAKSCFIKTVPRDNPSDCAS